MKRKLQQCGASHLDILHTISKETFIATFEKDNDPIYFQEYMAFAFTKEKLRDQLQNKNSQFWLAYQEDALVGYFKLNRSEAQTDLKDENAMELQRIYLLEKYQGQKLGQWMLDSAITLVREESQVHYIWLGVWEKNSKAIHFYQKNGFQKFGEHTFFMGKEAQTDWLMRLNLK
nr:GNAT family N-acetyltransferase [uncultured Allomuricauda sp.]